MNIRFLRQSAVALGLSLAALAPFSAQAHRSWLLPSATVLSGSEPWVTVDAAVSNDLFYFEHNPMRLDGLVITGPDGAALKPENSSTGRYRSTFDVKLAQPGTYRLAVAMDSLFASFKLKGEQKRVRGTAESLAKEIPEGAEELNVSRSQTRTEVFVTAGKPSKETIKPTGAGLELLPITHPNDLYAGEAAQFQFLIDGKPAPNLEVAVIPGGIRYRDKLNEMKIVTDANGKFSVKWPEPGMYWLNASVGGGRPDEGAQAPRGTLEKPQRRLGYAVTLEVLKP